MRAISIGFATAFLFGTAIAAGPKPKAQFIDLGGRKLWMQSAGKGGPTVVLEAGLGDDHRAWDGIFSKIAAFSHVVCYDRAGYGKSDPGPVPRLTEAIASDLHAMLQKSGTPGPYVLVGHSYGGAIIRAFAKHFKSEVVGLVFVDPLTEGMFEMISAEELKLLIDEEERTMPPGANGKRAEFAYLKSETVKQFPSLRELGSPPDVPTHLLVAGRNRPPHWPEAVMKVYGPWILAGHEASMEYVSSSSHYMQSDEPEKVVSAIRRVVFPDVLLALEKTIQAEGVPKAINRYREMKRRWPAERFRENILNTLGYQRLRAKDTAGAVALFKLNVEMYPKGFNTYDSLGEALLASGDREGAIRNYRRSLELNPENKSAEEALKRLGK